MQYLYRAVNTPPEFMKAKRAWTTFRFKSLTETKKIIKDAVEKDQAESLLIIHNRSPFKYVHSCSSEPTCKGYAGKRKYTYAFKYPKLKIFDLITKKYIPSIPKTKSDNQLLITDGFKVDTSSVIGLKVRIDTEVIIFNDIPLRYITHYKIGAKDKWRKLNWSQVKPNPVHPS